MGHDIEQPSYNKPAVAPSALTDGLCNDLLPCAHCGGVGLLGQEKSHNGEGGWYIECANPTCRMTTPLRYSCGDGVEELLAEIWNRRTQSHNAKVTGSPALSASPRGLPGYAFGDDE